MGDVLHFPGLNGFSKYMLVVSTTPLLSVSMLIDTTLPMRATSGMPSGILSVPTRLTS